ncbi:uncharacterized protein LOC111024658 [Momordica charantia]|uniref:Uncharacterized protein LOC111024658 n=1 Tax=Momordica charantia TaxID=3673 RepID=A0A6J1DYD5_MOMCH|nr:uncharacterized protein LOC111024658 [Momordica charantia]
MAEEILADLLHCSTAKEIWVSLQQMFATQNLTKVMQLKTQLQNLRKGGLSLKEYIRQIKNLVDSLKAAGKSMNTEDHIMHILSGLGSEYESTVSVITVKKGPLTIQDVTALLLSHQRRIEKEISAAKDVTLPSASINLAHQQFGQNNQNNSVSYNSNDNHRYQQHYSNDNNRGRGRFHRNGGRRWNSRNKIQCQICHRFGHTADRYYFRNSSVQQQNQYSTRYFQSSSPYHQQQNAAAMLVSSDINKDTNWYPDSGATNHVTHDLGNLSLCNEVASGQHINTANGAGSSHWYNSTPRETP